MSGDRMSAIRSTQHFKPCHCTTCFLLGRIDKLEADAEMLLSDVEYLAEKQGVTPIFTQDEIKKIKLLVTEKEWNVEHGKLVMFHPLDATLDDVGTSGPR